MTAAPVFPRLCVEVGKIESQLGDGGERGDGRAWAGIHGQHAEGLGNLSRDVRQRPAVGVDPEHVRPLEPAEEPVGDSAREHRDEAVRAGGLGREILRSQRPFYLPLNPRRRHRGRREHEYESPSALHTFLEHGRQVVSGPHLQPVEEAGDATTLEGDAESLDVCGVLAAVGEEDGFALGHRAEL